MSDRPLLASYFTIAGDVHPFHRDVPSPHDFRARVEAAARAGFRGIGLFHTDLPAVIARFGLDGMRAILDANGMDWVEVECLFDWFADGEPRAASDRNRRLLLDCAGRLGAFHMKVSSDFRGDATVEQLIEPFAQLCDDAAAVGTKVSLEMTPFSNTPDLQSVLTIVEGAGRPNGGLMLDLWHVVRGGVRYADIAALPAGRIFGVELDDAPLVVEGTLIEDTLERRRFCGEGEFDVAGFIAALDAAGFTGPYGIEVLSDDVRRMPLEAAARRAFDTTARFVNGVAGR